MGMGTRYLSGPTEQSSLAGATALSWNADVSKLQLLWYQSCGCVLESLLAVVASGACALWDSSALDAATEMWMLTVRRSLSSITLWEGIIGESFQGPVQVPVDC